MSFITARPAACVSTVHYAEVQFAFKQSHLHNMEYVISVRDKIDAGVAEICRDLDVVVDCDYRCQWEGARVLGSDIKQVQLAGKRMEALLQRFKYLDHIDQSAL